MQCGQRHSFSPMPIMTRLERIRIFSACGRTRNLATGDFTRVMPPPPFIHRSRSPDYVINLQFTFGSSRTNTLYFTNGILMRTTSPDP
jgi:hypothetical protein